MKVCTKCHIEKDEKEFHRQLDKLYSSCKECQCKAAKKSYNKNRHKRLLQISKYKKSNIDRQLAYQKKYRDLNKDKIKINREKYKGSGKYSYPERQKEYRQKNRSRLSELTMKWQKKNKERLKPLRVAKEKEWRDDLTDRYVKSLLSRQRISQKQINIDIIEIKRQIILIKRKLKNHVKENKKAN